MIGKTILHCSVIESLGALGMGIGYRAYEQGISSSYGAWE